MIRSSLFVLRIQILKQVGYMMLIRYENSILKDIWRQLKSNKYDNVLGLTCSESCSGIRSMKTRLYFQRVHTINREMCSRSAYNLEYSLSLWIIMSLKALSYLSL